MFKHVFKYRFKSAIRDRQMIFWTFIFPLVLATLFNLAFSNIYKHDEFQKIPISIIKNDAYIKNPGFEKTLKNSELFTYKEEDLKKARENLKNNKIDGYIEFKSNSDINIVVKNSGLNQTLMKSFMDNYVQINSLATRIVAQNPSALSKALSPEMLDGNSLKDVTPTGSRPDYVLTFFYALIAMSCLYGSFWGLREVTAVQANLSDLGARINIAPANKLKVFAASLLSASIIHIASIFLLIAFMGFVLKIAFGNQILLILAACVIGSLTGVSMGAMIAAAIKKGESVKVPILIAASMILSFLAGLMIADVKYLISKNIPALRYLNPANLIADSFYSLYYYGTYTVYIVNMALLAGFTVLFYLILYFLMRRQKYASI